MDPQAPGRAAVLPEIEARLLEASVRQRLFQRPAAPVRLGRYRLLERLGQGGMGVVYAAHDEQLDRRVAVKLLHAGRGAAAQAARLRREALALARLSHPNVVQVFEIGEVDGQAFVAMELVRGVTLRAWLAARPRAVDEILAVFVQAGRGLAAAHAAGLVHRDFKPENALVGEDGRVRVVDFGLARGDEPGPAAPDGPLAAMTETGAVLGTPAYMAPEQRGGAVVDARADQFALCVALHEALHGERPFAGDTADAYFAAVAAGRVRPPSHRRVPARVRAALLRGLRPDRDARWPDLDALLAALDRRPARRVLALALALALALTAAAAAALLGVRAYRDAQRERLAEARVAALEPRLDAMIAAGDPTGAQRLLADLAATPELRDTAAPAAAWARLAARLADRGLPAQAAWASAYVQARDPAARRAALLGLAAAEARARRWPGVAAALALLGEDDPASLRTPETLALRFAVAAAERDLAAALAVARDPAAPAGPRALAPVLAALATMRPTPHRGLEVATPLGRAALLLGRRAPPSYALVAAAPTLPAPAPPAPAAPTLAGLPPAPAAPALAGLPPARLHLARGADPPLLVRDDGDALALLVVEDGRLRELARAPAGAGPLGRALAADLDGDGRVEVYLGDNAHLRAFKQDASGAWSVADALHATGSDVEGLAAGDLDGDGRPELVLGLGAWSAYDVRVLRRAGPGPLALAARRKLGHTAEVDVIRTPGGPRIATVTTGRWPNSSVFPPEHRHGAPEGLYVLRLAKDRLEVERAVPVPDLDAEDLAPQEVYAGDLDGDGLDDVVVGCSQSPTPISPGGPHAWILRQTADGGFVDLTLAGARPLALADLDDDPADELLLLADDALWIAGTGDAALPPRPLASLGFADAEARALAAAGAPADVVALARVGAPALALATATQAAAVAPEPARRRLHLAAAAVAEDLQQYDRAAELLADPAADPALRPEALARLTRVRLAQGRVAAAADASARWLAEPGLDEPTRARAAAVHAPLAALQASRRPLPLRFPADTPAALDPAALRRDDRGALLLDSVVGAGTALAWPLTWPGGQVELELELDPRALEWSGGLELRLAAADGPRVRVGLRVQGGDVHHELVLLCGDAPERGAQLPVRPDGAADPLRLRVAVDPAAARLDCTLTGPAGPAHQEARAAPLARDLRLELGPDPGFGSDGARARFALTRVELAGATLRAADGEAPPAGPPAPPAGPTTDPIAPTAGPTTDPIAPPAGPTADPRAVPTAPTTDPIAPPAGPTADPIAPTAGPTTDPIAPPAGPTADPRAVPTAPPAGPTILAARALASAAALLVEGRPSAALRALAGLAGPRAALWRTLALAELGRWTDAAAALAPVLADSAARADLRRLLRGRPASLAPALRHALGDPAFFALYREAWALTIALEPYPDEVLRALVRDLDGVEDACPDPDTCAALLRARGQAHAQRGDRPRARADLAAARRLTADPAAAAALELRLAVLAAQDGDDAAALAHAAALVAVGPALVARDRLRARPELAALRATPAWQALLGPDDRTLELPAD
jgi:hypothetical protein